ncbi:hypothetical protein F5Y18DRAFT_381352 [Xylariaceae sp. FL1019]|nr:hypothetical protein F5Y18DRAFT_381352 [Xylariaceae sp. FL1019]
MDDFFDDDLDDLNDNTLQELENNAIQFTQAHKSLAPSQFQDQNRLDYDYEDYEDDDLDDTVVQNALQAQPALAAQSAALTGQLPARVAHQQQQQNTWGPVPIPASRIYPNAAGSNASRPFGAAATVSRTSQQIPPRSQTPAYGQLPYPGAALPRPPPPIPSAYRASQAQRPPAAPSREIAALEAQIKDLRSKLDTKNGEIGIVRSRLEKSQTDHERELKALKVQTAEQLAKQQRAIDAAAAARQTAVTELEFTKRDLGEELSRARRQDVAGTPKKNATTKAWGVSDGFEDIEMAGSPSKGQRGRTAGAVAASVVEPPPKLLRTPTKNKRKRAIMESPVMALETHSEDVVMTDGADIQNKHWDRAFPTNQQNEPFDYMKFILNHSAARDRPLSFQFLSSFELPSRPGESLSSILLKKLSSAGDPQDPTRLPIEFCLEVIRLWDSCKKEGILAPIMELVSLVTITLQLQTVALAPYIAPSLLMVAMDSSYEVAIPRFNNPKSVEPTDESFITFRDNIDTKRILSLLYLTALGCATSEPDGGGVPPAIVEFWSSVHIHFVLMNLSRKQPAEDFVTMLQLLGTSVFPDSIGPINPDKTPEIVAQLLINRVSTHLTDTQRQDVDELGMRNIRLTVLQTLSSFARCEFGLAQLVKHDWLITRLVTLLSYCIEELYDSELPYSSSDTHALAESLQLLVTHTVLLLHLIITTLDPATVSAKLAKTVGCAQRYQLSLARLNFADDLVSDETAELAHELLELAVTSEAGEELGEFFGG